MPATDQSATDDELSAAWQAGDPTAGAALFARHGAALQRFVHRRLGRNVEDITQDVWVAAAANIARYQRRSSFRTWLFAVANNHVRLAFRQEARTARLQTHATALDETRTSCPDDDYADGLQLCHLAAALLGLPARLQEIVALYYFERRSAAQIGRALAIPENTVRSRVRRARALLGSSVGRQLPAPVRPGQHPVDAWLTKVEFTGRPRPSAPAA